MSEIILPALSQRVLEAWGDYVGRSEAGEGPSIDSFSGSWLTARFGWHTSHYDRADGRFIPVYENEIDLKAIRMAARLMDSVVPPAQAARQRLTDYTISGGFDWTITHSSPEVQAWCKAVVKRFYDDAKFLELERDSFKAEIIDGEYLGQLVAEDGCITLQTCQPEWLTEPLNTQELDRWLDLPFVPTWTFGVLRRQYRDRNYGYHISRDESGCDWDFVKANRFVHWTRNVPREAKRGFSDGYTTHAYLGHADKVARNTAIGTAIQASIAYIVEHAQGTTSTQVRDLVAGLNNQVVKNDYTGQARVSAVSAAPGRRLDVKGGSKYTNGPLANANTGIYIDVMTAMFRLSGTVYAFPEHMLTGTAENNNFASSLVAESPFVQGRLADQNVRGSRLKQLFLQVIELACEVTGKSFEDIRAGLDIAISPPSIVTRDPNKMTEALLAQAAQGWVDDKTAIQELGRDYDTIKKNIDEQEEVKAKKKVQKAGSGSMGSISRQQWKRNQAAIADIRAQVVAKTTSPALARVMIAALGFTAEEADQILADTTPETPPDFVQKESESKLPESFTRTQQSLIKAWESYP